MTTALKNQSQIHFISISKSNSPFLDTIPTNDVNNLKAATKSYRKIIFESATKIGENTTNILNCYFSS